MLPRVFSDPAPCRACAGTTLTSNPKRDWKRAKNDQKNSIFSFRSKMNYRQSQILMERDNLPSENRHLPSLSSRSRRRTQHSPVKRIFRFHARTELNFLHYRCSTHSLARNMPSMINLISISQLSRLETLSIVDSLHRTHYR